MFHPESDTIVVELCVIGPKKMAETELKQIRQVGSVNFLQSWMSVSHGKQLAKIGRVLVD